MPTCTWSGCSYSAKRPSDLATHIRTHTGEKPFPCDWEGCKAAFTQSGNLTKHRRTHTGEKPFKCTEKGCKAAFAQAGDLAKHRRIHIGEKPFSCDWEGCKAAFTQSGNLARHRRTHTGEKPFSCDWKGCKAAFATSGQLANHRRTHTGERPFKCTEKGCEAAFPSSSNLSYHRRTKHLSSDPIPPKAAKRKASVGQASHSIDNPNPKRVKKQPGREQGKRRTTVATAPPAAPTRTDEEKESRQDASGGGLTSQDVIEIDLGKEVDGYLLNPFGLFLRTSLLPGSSGEGCFATASIPGGSLLGSYLEGGGVIKAEEGMELAECAREYLMDVVVRGRKVVVNNTSSMLAKLNHQWREGANVYFDGEGKFWAKAGGVALVEVVADEDSRGEEEEEEEDNEDEGSKTCGRKRKRKKKKRNTGGMMAELFVDYGHAYWIDRLLGGDVHAKYTQYARMKSSRRSGAQRSFMKACERKVEVLMPNVGVVQSAVDGAVREAFWAKRKVENRSSTAAAAVVTVKKEPQA